MANTNSVPCPTCHADVGEPCVYSAGATHQSRADRAEAHAASASARKLTVACVTENDPLATYLCGFFMGAYGGLPHESTDARNRTEDARVVDLLLS